MLTGRTPERNDTLLFLPSLLPIVTSGEESVSSVCQILSFIVSANLEERRLVFTRVGEKGRKITAIVVIIQIVAELASDIDRDRKAREYPPPVILTLH